jgi:hypothetical protein
MNVKEGVWDIIDQKNSKITKKLSGLHHYTSVDAMYHIINNQCLFASHLKYLNDYEEYNTGYEAVYNYIAGKKINEGGDESDWFLPNEFDYLPKESPLRSGYSNLHKPKDSDGWIAQTRKTYLRSILPEVFIISFCNNGDSLNNWIAYARENGVSIEFDFIDNAFIDKSLDSEAMREKIIINKGVMEMDYKSIVELNNCFPREILYAKETELVNFLSETIEPLIKCFDIDMEPDHSEERRAAHFWYWLSSFFEIVPFIKIGGFENEQEVRMAVRANRVTFDTEKSKESVGNIVNYRVKNNLIIPYMKIGWKNDKQKSLPIKSITVGPGKNQKMIFESIIQFIESEDNPVIPFEDKNKFGSYVNEGYKTSSGIVIKMSKIPYIF